MREKKKGGMGKARKKHIFVADRLGEKKNSAEKKRRKGPKARKTHIFILEGAKKLPLPSNINSMFDNPKQKSIDLELKKMAILPSDNIEADNSNQDDHSIKLNEFKNIDVDDMLVTHKGMNDDILTKDQKVADKREKEISKRIKKEIKYPF